MTNPELLLFGAYLTGVAVGLLVAGVIAVAVHTGRRRGELDDRLGPDTWPLPLLLADDETEWIQPTNLRDLPRRTAPVPPSPQRRTQ